MTARPAGAELLAAAIKLAGLLDVWERRPPASQPTPVARRAGADAVLVLDDLIRSLHRTRASLVAELRAHDNETGRQVDELLAGRSAEQDAGRGAGGTRPYRAR